MDQNIKEEIALGAQEGLIKSVQAFKGLPLWQRVILALFILGTVPGYFLARSVVQFGFEQTYKKYLVTAQKLVANPKPLSVRDITLLPLPENQYAVVAQIENQNLDLALSDARYLVTLKNSGGQTVGQSSGSYYMLAGEKKYLVISKVVAQEVARSAQIIFSNELWQNRLQVPKATLSGTDPDRFVQPDPLAYVVEGEVLNSSPFSLKRVSITVLLLDSDQKIVAAVRREEFDLPAGSRRAYKMLWPGSTGSTITSSQLQLETNVLDASNLGVEGPSDAGSLDRPDSNK